MIRRSLATVAGGSMTTGISRHVDARPITPIRLTSPGKRGLDAAETWRCKECHGWDYKSNQGQCAGGNHATGISGCMCAVCQGLEGRFFAKRHAGPVTREDPWHNMLNGYPDDTMPALREIDPKVISDNLVHMQTLQERR